MKIEQKEHISISTDNTSMEIIVVFLHIEFNDKKI